MRDSQSNRGLQAFGHCLMDGDPEVVRLARRNRRRSMFLSTLIQAGLLTAAIVVPLFASHTLKTYNQTPMLPPPRGNPGPEVRSAGGGSQSTGPRVPRPDFFTHFEIQHGIQSPADSGTDSQAQEGLANTCPGCVPGGVDDVRDLFSDGSRTTLPPQPPEPAPKPRGPIKVSQPVQEARLIHRVTPVYPVLAVQTKREGRVELRAIIATDGTIRELQVLSGHILFVQSALDAVGQWRYQPTLLNGEPVEVQTQITVIYVLNR